LPICADHIIFIGVFGSPETHFIKLWLSFECTAITMHLICDYR
jgi:hypothetical protein